MHGVADVSQSWGCYGHSYEGKVADMDKLNLLLAPTADSTNFPYLMRGGTPRGAALVKYRGYDGLCGMLYVLHTVCGVFCVWAARSFLHPTAPNCHHVVDQPT